MNDHTNGFPLIECDRLRNLQRALSYGQDMIVFTPFDVNSGCVTSADSQTRGTTDVSSVHSTLTNYLAARKKMATSIVAAALTSSATVATEGFSQNPPYTFAVGAIQPHVQPAGVEEKVSPLNRAVDFVWNQAIYRARKAAKEYGS